MIKLLAPLICAALLIACGPSTPAVDAPDDALPDGDDVTTDGPTPSDGAKPSDGIVRDADGDGVPDDSSEQGCAGKNETQCKINSACAWSDQGSCVDAADSPM